MEKMYELLDNIVGEIGVKHVVQVFTDEASNLVAIGRMLMENRTKLFWSLLCISLLSLSSSWGHWRASVQHHCNAKVITNIFRHTWVLILYRKHSNRRELARLAITHVATSLTLNRNKKMLLDLCLLRKNGQLVHMLLKLRLSKWWI